MPEPIIFYDIPGKDVTPKAWSPNTWKTRYCLNFKGLPYKTVWVEYPDIEAVMRKAGILPAATKADGSPYYTLPAIYDPNTKAGLAESAAIARYLDRTYPDTPRLIPAETDALHAAFNQAFRNAFLPDLAKLTIPAVANHLPPRSEVYFRKTREVGFGVANLDDIAPPGPKRDEAWAGVKKGLAMIAEWLQADGSDKLFFTGKDKIVYADMTVAGFLIWARVVLDKKEWEDLISWHEGRWGKFMAAFEKYEAVDEGEDAVL
ncbi:hypothetical protein ONZ51_g273 [Trametes cubensis]|uniref:GST N-terminal domain-containing protein n=1 Tax=Trametes cubensis TaxID=1111947 RepID=A0AAD7XFV6_9APHY|nr:hypothetical protein ONZ51_g273 [Trametes cubensis]